MQKIISRYLAFILTIIWLIPCQPVFSENFDPFGSTESAEKSNIDSSPVIPDIQFDNEQISIALQIISDSSGWSIFPSEEAAKKKISLWAKNISAKDVLDNVVTLAGLVSYQENSIIKIMTYDEYAQYVGLEKKIIVLENADLTPVAEAVKTFLTKLGKLVVHRQTNSIVLYDTAANVATLAEIVKKLDTPAKDSTIKVIDLKYADSKELAPKLSEVFAKKDSTDAAEKTENVVEDSVEVFNIDSTNRLIIKGRPVDLEKVEKLISELDKFAESTTKHYRFNYVDAAEIYSAVENIVSARNGSDTTMELAKVGLLEKSNSVILTGPPSVHRIMASLMEEIDVKTPYESGLIRVYKIDNADVEEIAKVITDLIEQKEHDEKDNTDNPKFTAANAAAPSSNISAPSADAEDNGEYIYKIKPRVTVNKSTNSVIIQASARVHRELEKLIEQLDKRRRQVLIKALIVEVITSDDLNLGVELNHAGNDAIAFSSFGLSEIDPATGARDLVVGPGGTAAVLRPDKVQAIIKALQSNSNARVTSAPQVLVNDNTVGFTNSIEEEPTMQINSSDTVATTSFAGYVEAGTQFAVTPHISEADYLRVEYQIKLNSFGAKSADTTIPPPRNTTSIQSEATVPNGSTIVVGGLQSSNESESVDKVPFVGDIPLVGELFKSQSKTKKYKTTYLFITPVIMEREDFSDLKDTSNNAMAEIKVGDSNE